MTQYVTTAETNTVIVDTDIEPETVVTASGSITSNNGYGIVASGVGAAYATIFGTVYANDTGINFAHDFSTVAVSASGIVYGGFAGVNLGGGQGILRNDGQILASDVGTVNAGVLLGGTENYIFNTGSIGGVYGIRAEFEGYRNQIVNRGVTSGSKTAISLNLFNGLTGSGVSASAVDPSRYGVFNHGDILGGSIGIEGTGPVRVVNTGLIDAADLGVSLTTSGGEQSSLTNSGTIVAAVAFKGGGGRDTVVNTGRIEGNLTFGDDADLYDGRGGRVFGTVALGDGNDTAHGGDADMFSGGFDDDGLSGHGGDDVLDGGAGSDTLDGGEGADLLRGGEGDDAYVVDSLDDAIEEAGEFGGDDTVWASISYVLGADVENLVLTGGSDLNGTGNDLANTLTGNDGDNVLDGGGGDQMRGGKGDDTYIVDDGNDVIIEAANEGIDTVRALTGHRLAQNIERLVLLGTDNIQGTGNELANTIIGNSGDNLLDGGAGVDLLQGGDGNDIYIVDHTGDVIQEAAGEGSEIIRATVSYTLGANLETLFLIGGNIDGTGNELSNDIMGSDGKNILDGGAGADRLIGGNGDDTYIVDSASDEVFEEDGLDGGTDTIRASVSYTLAHDVENLVLTGESNLAGTGNELDNVITGNDGDNRLDGGLGLDRLRGGKGNDTYVVDDAADVVVEAAGEGIDTIHASVSYALSRNVERLILTGADDIDAVGNELDNVITGNSGSNNLNGGAGADLLQGGDGNDFYTIDHLGDVAVEAVGGGTDLVFASVSFTLGANLENLILTEGDIDGTGNELANDIYGTDGTNILDGGAGNDRLYGGNGDDVYIVDSAGDLTSETDDGGGTDTVRASVNHTLNAFVENLVLTGTGDLSGTGNALGNALTGNGGSNTLGGGLGNDILDGGAGRDTAVFSGNRTNYDIVWNTAAGTVTVTDLVGDDGVDVLRNIELLQFSDTTLSLTNKAPSAPVVQGAVSPVSEGAPAHTMIATVRASDIENDALTYSFVTNPGGKFAIDPTTGVITLVGAVNYEATAAQDPDLRTENPNTALERKFYDLAVRATETASGISSGETTVRVYVADVNEAPTGLGFTDGTRAATIGEDALDGMIVGDLMALDPDGDTDLVFAFDTSGRGGSSGAGNAGGRFKIENGQLKVAALTDITRPETYTVTIKVTDRNGDDGSTSTYRDFLIRVNPVTETPDPVLSIAPPTVTNQNEGNDGLTEFVFTVTRTNPGGATDPSAPTQATWTISGANAGDFETTSGAVIFNGDETTKQIRVKVRGDTGFEPDETFTVTLSDPTNGATLGTASASATILNDDLPPPDTPVLSITADQGSKAEGDSGLTDFTFTVTRTNPNGESTAKWTVTGVDGSDVETLTGTVEFTGNDTEKTITVRVKGDIEAEGHEAFTVTLSDLTGATPGTTSASSTILDDDTVVPVNGPPSAPVLSGGTAREYDAAGTPVGTLSATDPDGDALSYELLDTAGGCFMLEGNRILVADGFRLDFEQQAAHTIKVRVKDATHTVDKDLVISVLDVGPENTAGSAANDVFWGGAGNDTLGGGAGADRLLGQGGADTLKGEAGHDVLGGGAGRDKLTGGKGSASRDAFLFDARLTTAKGAPSKSLANQHKDQILDFGPKFDSLWFDDAAFTNKTIAKSLKGKGAALDKPVKLKSSFFKKGAKATDKDDFFVYNDKTRKLYFDVDGSGSKAMVEIATLKLQKGEGSTLSASNFFFV